MSTKISNLVYYAKNIPMNIGIKARKLIHPLILGQMPSRREFDFQLLNEKPSIDGPALYVVTHSTCHDAPITCEALKDHFYVLVGKQKLELLDRVFFHLNGCVIVDRNDSNSQKRSLDKMVRLLKSGTNIVIFSEQTWCQKPSSPINHLRRGWVDVAKQANVPVVPLALEYYEYTDNICYGKFGNPIYVNLEDDKVSRNEELEDVFATLKFDIWETFPVQSRKDMHSLEWNSILEKRKAEYPKLDGNFEERFIIGNNDSPENVLLSPEYLTALWKLEKIEKNKRLEKK